MDMFTPAFKKTLIDMIRYIMKNIGLLILIVLLSGCNSGDRGQLVGVRGKKYNA